MRAPSSTRQLIPKPERQPKTPLDEQVFAEYRALQPFHDPDDGSGASAGEQFRDERDEANGEYYYYRPVWAHDEQVHQLPHFDGASRDRR